MTTKEVIGEAPFQILNSHSFSVSNSESGYTLMYSTDGREYTAWSEATPANECLVVNSIANGMFFYLSGNTSTVTIVY
jgi:hypothetical protein